MSTPPTTAPTSSTAEVLVSKIEYDGYDRAEKTTDTAGKVTRTFYNTVGRRKYVIENYDGSSTYWGTANGGPDDALNGRSGITGKDVNRITEYTFNTAGQLTHLKAMDPAYNGNGTTTDDQTTQYTYNTSGSTTYCVVPRKDLLITTTYPEDDTVTYTYHANGTLKTRTDQNGTVHEYVYDDLRRLTLDKVTTFSPTVDVDDTVKAIKRVYDDNGRLASVASYSGTTPSDGTNDVNGIAFTYANGFGLLTKSEQDHEDVASSGSAAVQYAYDMTESNDVITHAGRLTKVTYPKSGELTEREVFYNLPASGLGAGIDRLDAIADDDDSPTVTYAQFTYMGTGAIVKEAHPQVTNGLTLDYDTDTASHEYEYKGLDGFGRIVEQKWQSTEQTPTIKDHFSYGYDTASNRLWRKNEEALNQSKQLDEVYHDNDYDKACDGLHRLRHFRRGLITEVGNENIIDDGDDLDRRERWTLDGVGNWTELAYDTNGNGFTDFAEARTHNTDNEITDVNDGSFIDPTYDANGNMISGAKPGVPYTERHYRYDAWNRLAVVYIDGDSDDTWDNGSPDTLVEKYEYDGLHRRIVKIVPNAGTSTNRDRTDYYYNASWQVLEEKRADNVSTAVAANETSLARYQYIWSPRYIDSPVLRDADTDTDGHCTESGGSERLYYTTDANNNVTALVETDGDVIERYVYNPYGQPTIYNSATWASTVAFSASKQNEITYCGYRYSDGSHLYQSRHRWYDYAHGRWTSRDPKDADLPGGGYHDGMNLYEYVRSEPIGHVDWIGRAARGTTQPAADWITYRQLSWEDFKNRTPKPGYEQIPAYIQTHIKSTPGQFGEVNCTCKDATKCKGRSWPSADWSWRRRVFFNENEHECWSCTVAVTTPFKFFAVMDRNSSTRNDAKIEELAGRTKARKAIEKYEKLLRTAQEEENAGRIYALKSFLRAEKARLKESESKYKSLLAMALEHEQGHFYLAEARARWATDLLRKHLPTTPHLVGTPKDREDVRPEPIARRTAQRLVSVFCETGERTQ